MMLDYSSALKGFMCGLFAAGLLAVGAGLAVRAGTELQRETWRRAVCAPSVPAAVCQEVVCRVNMR